MWYDGYFTNIRAKGEVRIPNGGKLVMDTGSAFYGPNPYGAQDYFVDGNVSATGNGLSWKTAFSTLAEAIAASNTSIALAANRWWARRNRIFVIGDDLDEDLTTLPEKCDVIGMGCDDTIAGPKVLGHHSFTIASGKGMGCRLINMGWLCDQAGALFTFPAGANGLQILGGIMYPASGGSTIALSLTNLADIVIDGLEIAYSPGGPEVFGKGISILGTTSHKNKIRNCDIYATEGIHAAANNATYGGVIDRCNIYATALTVNDLSDLFRVTNCTLVTAANPGEDVLLGIVANKKLAAGNKLTGSGSVQNADYPFIDQSTS